MVIEVLFNNVIKFCGHSKFLKKSYTALNRTVKLFVKQGFKMSKKMKSIVVNLTLFKVHINSLRGPMVVKGVV